MFSIIIPVFSDKYLKQCLQAILDNTYQDKEIIVVNNNPQNLNIARVATQFPIKHIVEKTAGSYIARNTGAKNASGDILIFTDLDCIVDNKWLINIQKSFQQNIDGLMGKIYGINHNKIAELEQKFYNQVTEDFLNNKKKYLTRIDTRNFAIKKNVFQKINGFNENLKYGGDMEIGARLHEQDNKIIYANDVKIKHINETNINTIIKKRIKQNYDNYNITKYHDKKFIKKYFPHLLYHPNNITVKNLRIWFKLLLQLNKLFMKINLILLPGELKYNYFKGLNILAIKYGLLTNIVGKKIKL